jgi:hypothetical protein
LFAIDANCVACRDTKPSRDITIESGRGEHKVRIEAVDP